MILITENAEYIIVEQLGKDLSISGRTYFWPLVVNAINKHPIFGYGYQGFWQPWRTIDNPALPIRTPKLGDFIPEHSHNGFLDMGLDIGWLGLAFFIISLLINIYHGVVHVIRTNEYESSMPLIIFTWLIITNVTETGIATISFVWILYILMTARLTMDNTLETLRINSQHQRQTSWELESISETNRTSFRRSS
jgi:O-antigen ligase